MRTDRVRAEFDRLGEPLPQPWAVPPDANIPASLVRVVGSTAWVSGHIPTTPDGRQAEPVGKVGDAVSPEQARGLAVRAILNINASLAAALGSLDRVAGWLQLTCMVNAHPAYLDYPALFNPASLLLRQAYGPSVGDHARTAVGFAGLPWNAPVEIAPVVELDG